MSEYVYAGLTSQTIDIFLQDSSSSTGQGLSGLVYNSAGLVASYRKGATGSRVAITLATQTVGGAYSSGGFVEIDATHLKGVYRLDLPNAAVDTEGFVTLYLYGATNLLPTALRIDCRALPVDVKKVATQTATAAAGVTFPSSIASPTNITAATGIVLSAVTHTGAVIPTVTTVTNGLDAAGVRTAIGLTVANLDTQLADLPTVAEFEARSLPAASYFVVGDYTQPPSASTISSQVAADLAVAHGVGAWTTATGFSTLSQADIRTAVGLTTANLDTQISGIQSDTNDIQTRLPAALESGRIAAVLDSAVGTQITAIETFATRMTTGLVVDGAVYQFTANMLELGPSGGGGSSVNVLPATGIVSDRSAGTTLLPVVGETISQSITVYQSDGTTAVSLSGKTLKVIFETMSGVDVAVVAAADITISGTSSNIVTFAYPSAVTASERTLRFAIRDAAAPLTMYLQGVCSVVAAPKVDA